MRRSPLVILGAVLVASSIWLATGTEVALDGEQFATREREPSMEEFSLRKKYVDVGRWKVATIDEGSGPPVLLLHGCPFHAYEWRDIIPRLTPRHRVIAPDLLGLGDTRVRLTDDYRLPNDVTMVIGLLDALGIPMADVVGHDHGGATLQLMMGSHSQRIRRAVLTNAEAYDQWPSKPELPYLKLVVNPVLGPFFRFALQNSTWVQREVFSVAVHKQEAFTDEVLLAYTRQHTSSGARWKRLQRFFRWQLDPEHNRVTLGAVDGMRRFEQPTLVLWGKQDENFGPAIAERLAGDIPGTVGVTYLEESAHMPFQEEPEAYADALLAFLDADDDALAKRRAEWRAARKDGSNE